MDHLPPMKPDPVKVLLIGQPEEDYHRLLRRLASADRPFVLYQAPDGQIGLHMFKTLRPNCVVLELEQQDMAGMEVIERLNAEPAGNRVPILVWTHFMKPMPPLVAAILGITAYVQKMPRSHERLAAALLNAVQVGRNPATPPESYRP